MASQFGVSLITVRQSLRDLEGEGLIKKSTAKPATVASPATRNNPLEFQSFAAIAASNVDRRLVIKSYRKERSALACHAGGPIVATEMLYFSTTGEPVELTVSKNRGDQFSISFDAPNDLL